MHRLDTEEWRAVSNRDVDDKPQDERSDDYENEEEEEEDEEDLSENQLGLLIVVLQVEPEEVGLYFFRFRLNLKKYNHWHQPMHPRLPTDRHIRDTGQMTIHRIQEKGHI